MSAAQPSETPTRDRIIAAAMGLFGKQGFKSTTVAQIEAAAGLSIGAGGLYRHFASKRDLLEAGLRQQAANNAQLLTFIENPAQLAQLPLADQLLAIARAGLRRLEQERDVNRLLLRDLAEFPALLEEFRQQELSQIFTVLSAWLRSVARNKDLDVDALAAVLIEAVSHYWILGDVFGGHPFGIDEDRYLTAVAQLAATALSS
jgi:AcrR family transcriptional regulator